MASQKTDNEIIAEFMGMTLYVPENTNYSPYYRELDSKGFIKAEHYKRGNEYKSLAYERSWDWLMSVVQKIEDIAPNRVVIDCNTVRIVGDHSIKVHTLRKINSTYQAVVQFIKLHNAKSR